MTHPTLQLPPTTAPVGEPTTMTVYFFKPALTPFSFLIRCLQWLIGASWNAPTHVAVGFKDKLIQLYAEGLSVEPDTGAAYRLASNVITVEVDREQELMLNAIVTGFCDLDVYFDVLACICFVWNVLILRKKFGIYDASYGYGETCAVDSGRTFFFCPPVSCTTFVWQPLEDDLCFDWRIFAPAFLEQTLEDVVGE